MAKKMETKYFLINYQKTRVKCTTSKNVTVKIQLPHIGTFKNAHGLLLMRKYTIRLFTLDKGQILSAAGLRDFRGDYSSLAVAQVCV
jgi:hypothetical protein